MLIYLVIFLFLLIPVIRFDLMRIEGNKNLWFYSSLVLLIMLAGLRYRVGGDTLIYIRLFEGYPALRELSTFDYSGAQFNPLWYIFNAPFVTMKSFTAFQLAHALVVNSVFFWFFRRYVPTAYFTAILVYYFGYFCYFNMEVLRETLCICVLLLAYPCLEKKNFILYYILCVFALYIHMSAIVMMVIPLTLLFKRDHLWLCLLAMVAVVLAFTVFDIVTYVLGFAFEEQVASKINSYLRREEPNIFGILRQLLIIVPFLLFIFIRKKNQYDNDKTIGAMLVLIAVFQTAGVFIGDLVRFSNYLLPFGIVFIVNTFFVNYWDVMKKFYTKIVVMGALFVYLFNLSFYYVMNRSEDYPGGRNYHIFVPYYSVFNPQVDERRETLVTNLRSGEVSFE